MKFEIEIDDKEIKKFVAEKIANCIVGDRFSYDKNMYRKEIAQAVRDTIYKDKDNIVEMVVSRASKEVRCKAINKLLEDLKGM